MSRNIVPRIDKGADLGTAEKNWNKLYADAVILRGSDLRALLDSKIDLSTAIAKGDLFVATGAGMITRFPRGADGEVLVSNSQTEEGLDWVPAGARQELTSDITINVGTGGDFPTINDALAYCVSMYYPTFLATGTVPKVTINLLSGFVMNEQVLVESLNLSWITITGVDAETVINRSALTTYWGAGYYPAFGATNGGFLPIIGQLFNMDTSGAASGKHGILAFSNSRAIVLGGRGVKNAGARGIFAYRGSTINANGADASGAGTGICAAHGSTINAEGADASGAGTGIFATNGSTINANGADASGAGTGIFAYSGSTIDAYSANASGAGSIGIYAAHGSLINADNANASGAGTCGILAAQGSLISAIGAAGTLNQAKNTLTANGIIFQ